MTVRLRIAALAALAVLGACRGKSPPAVTAALNLPSSVAVFRGITSAHTAPDVTSNPGNTYHPHLAVANTRSDDLAIFDAVDDSLIGSPVPLHGLVYPVPNRPALLAAADLGDGKPDLLVAVSSGDSKLKVIRTWSVDGAVQASADVDFGPGADIVTIIAMPPDPATPGTARIVAALAGDRIGVAFYARLAAEGGLAIGPAPIDHVTSGALGFQAVDLAVIPGEQARIWAATPDLNGVAEIAITGTPVLTAVHDTKAPTRLVSAASLTEAIGSTALDPSAFPTTPPFPVIYAVLDETARAGIPGCGFLAPIACGLVAVNPGGGLLPDPIAAGTMTGTFRAPIPLVPAVGLAASQPPVVPPDPADPIYAGTFLRIITNISTRATTAAAGVASSDGGLTFVDLGRWEIPSQQAIGPTVKANVTTPGAAGQWLVLQHGTTLVGHLDPNGLSSAVGVTAGYTPTDRWIVTNQGVLPGLTSRRAEVGNDGTNTWLAMQVTDADGSHSEVVRLFDPVIGVHVGDTVVFDPNAIGTCPAFEATVAALFAPDATRPGGFVSLAAGTNPAFNQCLGKITPSTQIVRATIRAGGYVLVRGAAFPAQQHVGRPALGEAFAVEWEQEEPSLVATCLLPPAHAWPPSPTDAASCTADPSVDPSGCRAACDRLIRARLARRIGYLTEPGVPLAGPALQFTLALETTVTPARDLSLIMDTVEGRVPFRAFPAVGTAIGASMVLPWDRSPYAPPGGIRFFVPYSSGLVNDATPTLPAGSTVNTIH
jgi:hypothetical protein